MATTNINTRQMEIIKKMKEIAATILSKVNAKSGDSDEDEEEEEEEEEAALARVVLVNSMIDRENYMHYQGSKDWSGSRDGPNNPAIIQSGNSGKFSHWGLYPSNPEGSIGAVVYVGNAIRGAPNECAWLVAWNNPGYYHNPSQTNKVYVEAGHISKYGEGNIDWDDIRSKLMRSSQQSYYEDNETGGRAYAEIGNAHLVVVPAIFGVSR